MKLYINVSVMVTGVCEIEFSKEAPDTGRAEVLDNKNFTYTTVSIKSEPHDPPGALEQAHKDMTLRNLSALRLLALATAQMEEEVNKTAEVMELPTEVKKGEAN